MRDGETGRVKTRRVFYIPGYDPIPARRYRELYRTEGAAQAAISGYRLAMHGLHEKGRFGWSVTATMDGAEVATDIEVLGWSDIVQGSMAQGIAATYGQLARTVWTYIGSGAFFRLIGLRKGPVLVALYPLAMLIVQLLTSCLAGWAVAVLLGLWLPSLLAGLAGLSVVPLGLALWKRQDSRLFAHYLMHDYAFTAAGGGENPPELEARMAEFGKRIGAALTSEVDEVLVVGHSSGAHLAVSVLADLLRAGAGPRAGGAVLSFLSLGQVVPMASFLPRAWRLRADLAYLSQSDALTWVDVSAPGDCACFSLCDPVAVSGVAPEAKRWPLVLSAAFSQTLSPAKWKAMRWRFFRLHFQYLCAFDRPGDYDYFRITAGPLTLAARFGGRAPSASRIERSASPHRSLAA